jgi:hypothetical protein
MGPVGTIYHRQVSPSQHLEFRFNNRENPHMFRDAMYELLVAETLPYEKLTAS